MTDVIPFNKPFIAGKELYYIAQAVTYGNIAGDGRFTRACSRLLEEQFGIRRVLLVPSGTAALEMAAMLCRLGDGDEVVMPSYTFVSTANAFVRAGAKPIFVDIRADTLNLDESQIEDALTPRTRAIVPVHYGGVACEMDRIVDIARRNDLFVIEDAAQGVHAYYKGRALGSIGHLGCYSFHETKNYICGEGGALCINDERFLDRAEILRDKGTNRQQFLRGEVDKYTWVDIGSSYVPSEICSAFLYAQLEMLDSIAARRHAVAEYYYERLGPLAQQGIIRLPPRFDDRKSNDHMFYVIVEEQSRRDPLLAYLHERGIRATFHFVPLHQSPMARTLGLDRASLPNTERLAASLIRLPFFFEITRQQQDRVVDAIYAFFGESPS
ncbi:dTDP-4-amino-4,6-dideoxygalactose transaminase [Thermostilla marina]